MLIDEAGFNSYIDNLEKLVKKTFKDVDEMDDALTDLNKARVNKNLKSTFFQKLKINNNTALQKMRSSCESFTTFNRKKINFAIIQKGSRMHLGPFMPFK